MHCLIYHTNTYQSRTSMKRKRGRQRIFVRKCFLDPNQTRISTNHKQENLEDPEEQFRLNFVIMCRKKNSLRPIFLCSFSLSHRNNPTDLSVMLYP